MSRFFESIQVNKGKLVNLEFHQERFERTRRAALGLIQHPRLEQLIELPQGLDKGLFKCRVTYRKEVELIEYEPRIPHKIRSLKLVRSDSIDYAYKYQDRSKLNELFELREGKDDILIVKDNCITDSYFANVLFWDGKEWLTPDTPLLPGIMRAFLMHMGLIRECRITRADLNRFQKVKLINAMNDLQTAPEIHVNSIH